MKKRIIAWTIGVMLLTACSEAPEAETREEVETPDAGWTDVADSAPETVGGADALLPNAEPYVPENNMEPDIVSADTMGEVLCDETLPDGLRIVCYWEPGTEYTKYWAVRQGDELLRFCKEDSAYQSEYSVEVFSDVLGQSGFRILAPRGAAYNACDYYVLDGESVPRLLAGCANEVEEADFNQDGETDLRWYYHGGRECYTYFRQDGQIYLSSIDYALK